MLINRISRLMGEHRQGITTVSRATGISYKTAFDLYHGNTKRIDFRTLDRLCKHFKVGPSEVFEYVDGDLSGGEEQ